MEKLISISGFRPQAVVLDAGLFPTSPLPLQLLDSGAPVVCCDGAAVRLVESGRTPWRIVGDCDSLPPGLLHRFEPIVRRNPDQETNDQTKAVTYLVRRHGMERLAILGATGLREDHTLGNISLLAQYLRLGVEARIYTDFGMFAAVRDDARFECAPGTQVSVFGFGTLGMHSRGLRYPLRDFDSWWQGTLNECPGTGFSIRARGVYIVFLTYPEVL